jgi:hypothetical protein
MIDSTDRPPAAVSPGWAEHLRTWTPRVAAGTAMLAVAVATGWISYTHIFELTVSLHEPVATARVWPVGVDGLIVIGSVLLLTGKCDPWLGWLGIGFGVTVSVFANIMSQIAYGPLAAGWAACPALGFALSTFLLERWLKAQVSPARPATARRRAARPETASVPARSAVAAAAPRTAVPAATLAAAADAYRDSVAAGKPLSERKLAAAHLDGNRRAAARVIAAAAAA